MDIIKNLLKDYKNIYSKKEYRPKWSVTKINSNETIHPTIPFVGKNYNKTKILLYASAETLKNYNGCLDDDNIAKNRHRYWFDNHPDKSFFPKVHIAPMDKGGLVNIIGYITKKYYPDFKFETPRELLESVAFANIGKFTIKVKEGQKNKDYIGNFSKLSKSLEYIKSDIRNLKPKILIIPKEVKKHKEIINLIKNELPNIIIIPIYQINHFNINRADRLKKYKKKSKSELGILTKWQENFGKGLRGITNDNFYSFYTFLDEQIEIANKNR